MKNLAIFETAPDALLTGTLPTAAWDLVSFFANAESYLKLLGGGFISLIGLAAVVWAGFLIIKKFMGNAQSNGDSWFKIIAMFVIGGAMMFGGIGLLTTIAEGGKTTIEELGGGFIVLQSSLGLLR